MLSLMKHHWQLFKLTLAAQMTVILAAILAHLGARASTAAGNTKTAKPDEPSGHMWVVITLKNGRKWVIDPTWGKSMAYEEYYEKYIEKDTTLLWRIYPKGISR